MKTRRSTSWPWLRWQPLQRKYQSSIASQRWKFYSIQDAYECLQNCSTIWWSYDAFRIWYLWRSRKLIQRVLKVHLIVAISLKLCAIYLTLLLTQTVNEPYQNIVVQWIDWYQIFRMFCSVSKTLLFIINDTVVERDFNICYQWKLYENKFKRIFPEHLESLPPNYLFIALRPCFQLILPGNSLSLHRSFIVHFISDAT